MRRTINLLRHRSYSTSYATAAVSTKDTLYGRLLDYGSPKVSIEPVLNQWVFEGRDVEFKALAKLIKQLRTFKRYTHALQVSEWMSNKRYFDLVPAGVAIRLDLICKVRGIEEAETYFNTLPSTFREKRVYGALLNCYAQSYSLEKAEATMQTMRTLGFVESSICFNVMLKLYAKMGQHEKLDSLMKEMEERGIPSDKITFNTRLHAYIMASDMEGMERFLKKMEATSTGVRDWNAYIVAANGYLRNGNLEKASEMLKKSERLVKPYQRWFAYEVLITVYAGLGDKEEIHRLWNLYKKTGKSYNIGYLSVISSLAKVDDLDGAEDILAEWEKTKTVFDLRVPTTLINAYLRKGDIMKVESIMDTVLESGQEVSLTTWGRLAALYLKKDQIHKAMSCMKKVISETSKLPEATCIILVEFLEYLRVHDRIAEAEELIGLLKAKSFVGEDGCVKLVDFIRNKETTLNTLVILEKGVDN